ncbi:MAG: OmpA family protein, partial [Spirochaetota bacterium]
MMMGKNGQRSSWRLVWIPVLIALAGTPSLGQALAGESRASLYRAENLPGPSRENRDGIWEEVSSSLLARDIEAAAAEAGLANFGVSVSGRSISVLYQDLLFQPNSDKVTPESLDKIQSLARVLSRFQGLQLLVEGHSARLSKDDRDNGLDLSGRRARSVASLMADTGIFQADRIESLGRGFFDPIADYRTPAGKARNRRVEISIVDTASAGDLAGAGTVLWRLFSDSKAPGCTVYLVAGEKVAELESSFQEAGIGGLLLAGTPAGIAVLDDLARFGDDDAPSSDTLTRQLAIAQVVTDFAPLAQVRIGGYGD